MSPKEQYNKNDYTWLWLIVILCGLVLFNKCTGVDPFQFGGSDQGDRAADYADSSDERAISDLLYDCSYGPGDSYSDCMARLARNTKSNDTVTSSIENETEIENETGCPNGCDYHKTGCHIKGNISFDSKEKIYHLPGMEFYLDTKINPEYGEKWFCTEEEATANGWRKARND